MTTNLFLRIRRDGVFIFRWNGYPLRQFTLREALRYAQSSPDNTFIDERVRDDFSDEQYDDFELNQSISERYYPGQKFHVFSHHLS